jgi:hypothetical protein
VTHLPQPALPCLTRFSSSHHPNRAESSHADDEASFLRCVLGLIAALAAPAAAFVQNGSNYHVLSNGPDASLAGIGAGLLQTGNDGIGTYIPGEDLRGSILVDPDGTGPLPLQFCYRNKAFTESVCLYHPGLSGFLQLRFAGLFFIELDGLDPNAPVVFTRPVCSSPITASFLPYGTGPSSTVSFLGLGVSALGPTHTTIMPDNGLFAGLGTRTVVGAGSAQIPSSPTGSLASGCYSVRFEWVASALPLLDGIDGLWHWAVNSDDANQYWQMSVDEMNLWRSNTAGLNNNATETFTLLAVVDYVLLISSLEANTHAALAPHGIEQNGPYYDQTENMVGGGGPNFGFDIGRGSRAVSFTGLGGVKVPPALGGLGNGAQDPGYGPGGTVPTLGFVTWDGKANSSPATFGSTRVTWVSLDLAQVFGGPPGPGVTKGGGTVRLPVEVGGFAQPITLTLLPILQHPTSVAPSGWPHPLGIANWPNDSVAGGSIHIALSSFAAQVPCNIGLPLNLQYGTTGRNHTPPPGLTFDPGVADISGRKELYLFR